VFFVFLLFQGVFAQQLGYQLYTVSDGLVQSEVTCLHQDKKGFLWVGTKLGISRFDGNTFTTIRDTAGVSESWVKNALDISDSSVAFLTMKGVVIFSYGIKQNSIIGIPMDIVCFGMWNDNGKSYFLTSTLDLFRIDLSGLIREKVNPFTRLKDQLARTISSQIIFSKKYHKFYFKNIRGELVCFDKHNITVIYKDSYLRHFSDQEGNIYFLSPNQSVNQLFEKQLGYDVARLPKGNETPRLYRITDTSTTLLRDFGNDFSIMTSCAYAVNPDNQYYAANTDLILHHLVSGQHQKYLIPFPSGGVMYMDREQNLWVGTAMGLLRIKTPGMVFFDEKNGLIQNLQIVAEDKNNRIIVGNYSNGMQQLAEGRLFSLPVPSFNGVKADWQIFPGCLKDHHGNILISVNPYCFMTWDGKKFSHRRDAPLTDSYCFQEDSLTGEILTGTNMGLVAMFPDKPGYQVKKIPPGNKQNGIVSMITDNTGRLLLGGFKGLSFLKEGRVTHLPNKEFPFKDGANAMAKDHRGNIWIGNTKGLWMFDLKKFRKIVNPWFNDLVVSLFVIDSTNLFIGGLHGIGFMDLQSYYKNDTVIIRYFNSDNGFSGIECQQNAVTRDHEGFLWVATTNSLLRIDPVHLPPPGHGPDAYIEKISLIDDNMKLAPLVTTSATTGRLDLNHYNQNLRFDFTAPFFRGPSFLRFRYYLQGQDKQWSQPTNERYAVYTNLKPGTYTFKVIACNDAGIWSDVPAAFTVVIHPAFWQTWWFQVFIILTGIGLISGSTWMISQRLRRQKQRELVQEKTVAELQFKTLRNQLAPHFIFNALNTIGSSIYQNDTRLSYDLLQKFSRLIRSTLTHADKTSRSLSEELDFVNCYLDIENIRFGGRIRHKIEVGEGVPLDMQIPRMIIQTYTENAVKHGLLNKQGEGLIRIGIRRGESDLEIVIEDDGVGRQASVKYRGNSTGKGMEIITQFIQLFNTFNTGKVEVNVTDLYADSGEPIGTRVAISIPLNYTYTTDDEHVKTTSNHHR